MTYSVKVDKVPYSSVVGGGLILKDLKGHARFIVMIIGTTEGVTKEEDAAICEAIRVGIAVAHDGDIEIPERT